MPGNLLPRGTDPDDHDYSAAQYYDRGHHLDGATVNRSARAGHDGNSVNDDGGSDFLHYNAIVDQFRAICNDHFNDDFYPVNPANLHDDSTTYINYRTGLPDD